MKRTELKRKTPLRAKPKPFKPKVKDKRKPDTRWRSPKYLAFVRTLPCCVCGRPANAAHHIKGLYHLSGASLKAPDSYTMPVFDGPGDTCHRKIHDDAGLRARQPEFILATIAKAAGLGETITSQLAMAVEFLNDKATTTAAC